MSDMMFLLLSEALSGVRLPCGTLNSGIRPIAIRPEIPMCRGLHGSHQSGADADTAEHCQFVGYDALLAVFNRLNDYLILVREDSRGRLCRREMF